MNLFEEFCSKLNIDWSDIANNDLFTTTELVRWLQLGHNEAIAKHPWPFTEGRLEVTTVSGQEQYDYPSTLKSDSLRYLTVNGERYSKLLFEDYLKFKEDYSTSSEKKFSDRNRIIYVNSLADGFSNSIVCYGQVMIEDSLNTSVSTTVFSLAAEPEAEEAIIKLAYAKALGSEKMKNPTKAKKEKEEADAMLNEVWKKISDRQHTYKTKDTPMFKRLNVLEGGYEDDLRSEKQF